MSAFRFTVLAKQIELEAPANCAYVQNALVSLSEESPDHDAENDGLAQLRFVSQKQVGGQLRAVFNIGMSFGGAPGTQPASLVEDVRLTLTPFSWSSRCKVSAYALR